MCRERSFQPSRTYATAERARAAAMKFIEHYKDEPKISFFIVAGEDGRFSPIWLFPEEYFFLAFSVANHGWTAIGAH